MDGKSEGTRKIGRPKIDDRVLQVDKWEYTYNLGLDLKSIYLYFPPSSQLL